MADFRPAGSYNERRHLNTTTLPHDGRVLVVGGSGDHDILFSAEVWNPEAASFVPAGTLAEARVGHTSTRLDDGRVLVVGGQGVLEPAPGTPFSGDPYEFRASAEVWDPVAEAFGPAGTLTDARSSHTAIGLPDGGVLVVGGPGRYGTLASAEVWEPSDGQSTADPHETSAAGLPPARENSM